jgi:hypothetical protein
LPCIANTAQRQRTFLAHQRLSRFFLSQLRATAEDLREDRLIDQSCCDPSERLRLVFWLHSELHPFSHRLWGLPGHRHGKTARRPIWWAKVQPRAPAPMFKKAHPSRTTPLQSVARPHKQARLNIRSSIRRASSAASCRPGIRQQFRRKLRRPTDISRHLALRLPRQENNCRLMSIENVAIAILPSTLVCQQAHCTQWQVH